MEKRIHGNIHEENKDVSITITDGEGNTNVNKDNDEIKIIINDILNERLKYYFLIDGEKIEKLSKADNETKREVSNAVKKLINIDALEVAINALKKLTRNLEQEVKDNTDGEINTY